MASEYDFRNLERELDGLEQKYSSFVSKKDSIISSAKSIKFDDNKYGKYAIEKKVNSIVNDGKKELESYYNSSLNAVSSKAHASQEKVKSIARDVNDFVVSLNKTISNVHLLNEYFTQRDYLMVIDFMKTHHFEIAENNSFGEYLNLLKIESMDKQCELYLSLFDGKNAQFFIDYVNECKDLSAKSHLPLAYAKSILYYSKLVEITLPLNKNKAYEYARIGIAFYKEADDIIKSDCQKSYKYMYAQFVTLYNDLSDVPFNSFDYASVMAFLADSVLLNKEDISNEYFKTQDNTVYSHFKYVILKAAVGDTNNHSLAIADTISLVQSNHQKEYYSFWLGSSNTVEWSVISSIFTKQEQLFSLRDNLGSSIVVFDCIKNLSLSDDTIVILTYNISDYYYNCMIKNKKEIPFLSFLKALLSIFEAINNCQNKKTSGDIKNKLEQLQRKYASITYATIKKNKKYCANLKDKSIELINGLYFQSAELLGVNKPKNDLMSTNKSIPLTDSVIVQIYTNEEQEKNKKAWIIGGSIAAVVIVALIIILIIVLK